MKYYEFSDYIIGVNSKCDVLSAINAYFCLIGDADYVPNLITESEGYDSAVREGYEDEELEKIENDETGLTVALIRRF